MGSHYRCHYSTTWTLELSGNSLLLYYYLEPFDPFRFPHHDAKKIRDLKLYSPGFHPGLCDLSNLRKYDLQSSLQLFSKRNTKSLQVCDPQHFIFGSSERSVILMTLQCQLKFDQKLTEENISYTSTHQHINMIF